ncbi:hypothetical protein ACFQ6U_14075 [Streptomyces sp. NPDC056465]|uniref:hypothetical protein n=1 Tax=Streptomyces sp. NPDC056465 TaxID=3345829 RepID=UPI0036C693D7
MTTVQPEAPTAALTQFVDKDGIYAPPPGTEYVYVLSDYARAGAAALGAGWGAESGYLGAWGLIFQTGTSDRVSLGEASTLGDASVRLFVDSEGDMCLELHHQDFAASERYFIRSENLPEFHPRTPDDMTAWGEAIAAAIRLHYFD